MKISSIKKIVLEEFPSEVRGWLVRLISPLNQFLEQTYQILTNGITLRDNMKQQTIDLDVAAGQVYPIKVAYRLNERPTSVTIGHIVENNAAPGVIPVHSMQWTYVNGTLEVSFSGLSALKAYKTTLIAQV